MYLGQFKALSNQLGVILGPFVDPLGTILGRFWGYQGLLMYNMYYICICIVSSCWPLSSQVELTNSELMLGQVELTDSELMLALGVPYNKRKTNMLYSLFLSALLIVQLKGPGWCRVGPFQGLLMYNMYYNAQYQYYEACYGGLLRP